MDIDGNFYDTYKGKNETNRKNCCFFYAASKMQQQQQKKSNKREKTRVGSGRQVNRNRTNSPKILHTNNIAEKPRTGKSLASIHDTMTRGRMVFRPCNLFTCESHKPPFILVHKNGWGFCQLNMLHDVCFAALLYLYPCPILSFTACTSVLQWQTHSPISHNTEKHFDVSRLKHTIRNTNPKTPPNFLFFQI